MAPRRDRLGTVLLLIATLLAAVGVPAPSVAQAGTEANAACAGEDGEGLIVYQDHQVAPDGGDATPAAVSDVAVVVVTPAGREVHRLAVPGLDAATGLGVGCWVIAHAGAGRHLLIDAASGTVREVTFAGAAPVDALRPVNAWQRNGHERRLALVGTGVADSVFLLDLESGRATDLAATMRALMAPPPDHLAVTAARIAAGEEHVLLATLNDLAVLPTAEPAVGRLLAAPASLIASFSDDGRRVLYTREAAADRQEVVLEQVDGSGAEVLAAGEERILARFVPGQGSAQVVLSRPSGLSLLSVPGGDERVLLTADGARFLPFWAPSGGRLVVQDANAKPVRWTWLDLDTGQTRVLDQLAGHPFLAGLSGDPPARRRWAYVLPEKFPLGGVGEAVLGLDLETGEVRATLALEEGVRYEFIYTASVDGRYAVLAAIPSATTGRRIWLLDAAAGRARLLTDDGRGEAFSPDGQRLVVGVAPPAADAAGNGTILLFSTEGAEDGTLLAEGVNPQWLSPGPPEPAGEPGSATPTTSQQPTIQSFTQATPDSTPTSGGLSVASRERIYLAFFDQQLAIEDQDLADWHAILAEPHDLADSEWRKSAARTAGDAMSTFEVWREAPIPPASLKEFHETYARTGQDLSAVFHDFLGAFIEKDADLLASLLPVYDAAEAVLFNARTLLPAIPRYGDGESLSDGASHDIVGAVLLIDRQAAWTPGDTCVGADKYAVLSPGTAVDVLDSAPNVLAFGPLGEGRALSRTRCWFEFEIDDVPATGFYSFTLDGLLAPGYKDDELAAMNWAVLWTISA